ncbi:DinB family protein [Mucilaginibacter sp. HC2]|uniref:DinB family protein n=1 Tax=Mucilaginibacter inviolabilis TaxID=2714892 RepID=UPI00140DCC17|nr:DinB family protein [Mucilaginibacter inviolabilis]NHA07772.1 DinB family protein [Mucilaginibacter inviolabilis]
MLIPILKTLFIRDLEKLKVELELYRNEQNIWLVDKQITNTAGNLCLHLIGNLNTYIGAELGKTGYIRNRPLEFSSGPVPRTELLKSIDETIQMIDSTLDQLSEEQMANEYPQEVTGGKVSTGYFLTHLATHLSYHLGQVNYHRRLLDN